MPEALEVVTGIATAPSTTLTALTAAAGNSFTVRSADFAKKISLIGVWGKSTGAGVIRIRQTAGSAVPRYPLAFFDQPLLPQDALTVEVSGSASAGKIETVSLLILYRDLPGVAGRFISPDQVDRWGVNLLAQEIDITPGAGGNYSGQAAINASFDTLKGNTDYALIGGLVDAECATVRIQGSDIGNLGVGFPGTKTLTDVTARWFSMLSEKFKVSVIPVFNSANKASILVDVAQDEAAGAVNVTLFLVELMPPQARK